MTMKHFTNEDIYQIGDFEKSLCYEVDKDTVGQYTGLHDKNGKEIYEGDIVAIQGDLKSFKTQVEWHKDIAAFILKDLQILDVDIANFTAVIGNIYDNPELLGGE